MVEKHYAASGARSCGSQNRKAKCKFLNFFYTHASVHTKRGTPDSGVFIFIRQYRCVTSIIKCVSIVLLRTNDVWNKNVENLPYNT